MNGKNVLVMVNQIAGVIYSFSMSFFSLYFLNWIVNELENGNFKRR